MKQSRGLVDFCEHVIAFIKSNLQFSQSRSSNLIYLKFFKERLDQRKWQQTQYIEFSRKIIISIQQVSLNLAKGIIGSIPQSVRVKQAYEDMYLLQYKNAKSNYKYVTMIYIINLFRMRLPQSEIKQIIKQCLAKQVKIQLELIIPQEQSHLFQYMVSQVFKVNHRQAINIVKRAGLPIQKFPDLIRFLEQNSVIHFAKQFKEKWYFGQQKFKQNKDRLAIYVVQMLKLYGNYQGAASIISRNNIEHQKLIELGLQKIPLIQTVLANPIFQKDSFDNLSQLIQNQQIKYLKLEDLGLKQTDVQIIQTKQQLLEAVSFLKKFKVLGFDSQFLGGFTKFQRRGVSIVQICCPQKCYIFDLLRITQVDQRILLRSLITDQNIIIVGHTLKSDQQMLQLQLQNQFSFKNIFDVCQQFKNVNESQVKTNLSFICQTVLGKSICKLNQTSNWKLRPLRLSQVHYAAMDAAVCLALYNNQIHFKNQQIMKQEKQKKQLRLKQKQWQSPIVFKENFAYPRKLQNFIQKQKFVIDSMAMKLAKQLRSLGIDAQFFKQKNHQRLIENALQNERIVVTRDSNFFKHKCKYVPVFLLHQFNDSLQQVSQLVSYFKIDLSKYQLFSRCVKCNSKLVKGDPVLAAQHLQFKDKSQLLHKNVMRCQGCQHYFWQGGQYLRSKLKYQQLRNQIMKKQI